MASEKQTVLVTGSTGFLGKTILTAFGQHKDIHLIAACRNKSKLPGNFSGEIREGDLRDTDYLASLVKDVDVICHTGTWAAMWGHRQLEQQNFYQPSIALIEAAIQARVKRFLMTSTVVIAKKNKATTVIDDFSETQKITFWPHVDYLIDIDNYMKANAHRGMNMITMRLGHFVGAGNKLGLVPVLTPRLKSWLVPWLAGGKSRLPLVADSDLGNSFVKASFAKDLHDYESFNICGSQFPTTKKWFVISQIKPVYPRLYSACPTRRDICLHY